jgi:hypothetical protein
MLIAQIHSLAPANIVWDATQRAGVQVISTPTRTGRVQVDRPVMMGTSIRVRIAMEQISVATTAPPYPGASPEALSPVATVRSILPAVHFAVMARATAMRPR